MRNNVKELDRYEVDLDYDVRWVYADIGGPKADHHYHSYLAGGVFAWDNQCNPICGEHHDIYYANYPAAHITNLPSPNYLRDEGAAIFKVHHGVSRLDIQYADDGEPISCFRIVDIEVGELVSYQELPPVMQYRVRSLRKNRNEAGLG